MEYTMINLGVFNSHIEKEIEKRLEKRGEEKDPLNIVVIDAEIRLLSDLLEDYKRLIINQ